MLREIGPGENGFVNDGDVELSEFPGFLQKYVDFSKGVNLEAHQVPMTMYWLYIDGKPVGYGKLRHCLNDALRKIGGHIGYAIRPTERGKGYAKVMLKMLLAEAGEKGIDEVLLTCMEENLASRKVIEANGGILSSIRDGECYYRVNL